MVAESATCFPALFYFFGKLWEGVAQRDRRKSAPRRSISTTPSCPTHFLRRLAPESATRVFLLINIKKALFSAKEDEIRAGQEHKKHSLLPDPFSFAVYLRITRPVFFFYLINIKKALRSAKEDEIRAGQEQLDNKSEELAVTNEKNAQAKEDLEDTSNALSSDQKFLIDLKERYYNKNFFKNPVGVPSVLGCCWNALL